MQAEAGARQKRSVAVALLGCIGAAALVGAYMTHGGSAPSLTGGLAALPVFPLLEEAAALQVPVSKPPRTGAGVDRRTAIAAGLGVLGAVGPAPAWAKKTEDLSPYSKVDPKAFGGGRTMSKDFKTPKQGEGLMWTGPKFKPNYPGEPGQEGYNPGTRVNSGVPLNSKEEALALIKNSGARTFEDLAEGPQSGGGWQDHMDATRKQTERLYEARAKLKGSLPM